MANDAPKADLGFGPTMLPVTTLPESVREAHASGPDLRGGRGRTVAYALRVHADLRVGDREFDDHINMHEVVMLRRYYEESGGGSVALTPQWKPYLPRLIPLDQQELQAELARMNAAFQIPRANSIQQILPAYFGTEPAEQLRRLHDVMRRQMEAWARVVKAAEGRIPEKEMAQLAGRREYIIAAACEHITAKELEEVANIADPGYNGADQIELPSVLAPDLAAPDTAAPVEVAPAPSLADIEAQVNAEQQGEDPSLALIEKFKGVGCDETQAAQLASLVEMVGAKDLRDDDIISTLGSKAKLAAVRRALKGA